MEDLLRTLTLLADPRSSLSALPGWLLLVSFCPLRESSRAESGSHISCASGFKGDSNPLTVVLLLGGQINSQPFLSLLIWWRRYEPRVSQGLGWVTAMTGPPVLVCL